MQSIGLDEMDRVALMDRVDTKYVFSDRELPDLLTKLRDDYRVLTVGGTRLARYTNLYFDSPALDCYLEHHNGKMNRRKFRMRKYLSTGVCFLEVKHKNNKRRTIKTSIPIPEITEELTKESLAFLQSNSKPGLDLLPKLWNSFSRITLVDKSSRERVTMDFDLEFYFDQQKHTLPGIVIAEVKQQKVSRHSRIRQLLRTQKVRPLRVSKYCLGTLLLNPQFKANRFKRKLRAIRKITI